MIFLIFHEIAKMISLLSNLKENEGFSERSEKIKQYRMNLSTELPSKFSFAKLNKIFNNNSNTIFLNRIYTLINIFTTLVYQMKYNGLHDSF